MAMLIRNGLVVTFEPDALRGRVIADGAVAVEDGKIAAIGESRELSGRYAKASPVIDASGRIVMPGFIVTHTHMPYVLGHNIPVDFTQLKTFWDMLQKMGWEWLEDITTAEGIYAATRYAAAKMLKSGTTTVCELVEGPNALPGALDASAKAIDEVGIRAQLGFEVTERIPGVSILERLDPAMAGKAFDENLRLMERYPAKGNARIQARLGVHTAFTNSFETLREARRIADERGCGIQIHIAEIPRAFLVEKYGKSAPMVLEEQGVLGPDVVAAHCIDLTDEDLEILRRNKVNVAHTPMTNSLGGNGVARVPDMIAAGMNVTLGHDCFFTLDVSEYLRYAYLVHKAHRANPGLIPPFQALDMALGNGARALGLGDRIGSLAVGKCADILVVRPDSPSPVVPSSVQSWYTMTFQGRSVETVIVDGKVVVKDGRLTTVREDEVEAACVAEAKKLWRRNGIAV
ncbi:MAG: amidohydrolase [Spirochaetes bacterium]|nr:amidohydrolase [Spirochaetota bacterium]